MNHGTQGREAFSSREISGILARYRRSGLGLVQFAQEQGVPPGRLHYWVYQRGRRKPRPSLRPLGAQPVFQEVKVAPWLPAVGEWAAEVGLPGGLAVRFSPGTSADWIGAVVQALQRSC